MRALGPIRPALTVNLLCAGSSVGSVFAALIGTRTDDQIAEVRVVMYRGRLAHIGFDGLLQLGNPGTLELSFFPKHATVLDSVRSKFRRWLYHGVLMDVKVLGDCIRHNLGCAASCVFILLSCLADFVRVPPLCALRSDLTFQEAYDRFGRITNVTCRSELASVSSHALC